MTRLDGPSRITLGCSTSEGASSSSSSRQLPEQHKQQEPNKGFPPQPVRSFDYSKWDTVGCDDDSDGSDDSDDGGGGGGGGVGGDGARHGGELDWEDPLDASEQARLQQVLKSSHAMDGVNTQAAGGVPGADAPAPPWTPSTTDGPPSPAPFELLRAKLTRNGAERGHYLWRQTECEVEFCVLLPAGTRARELRPELLPADPLSGARQRIVVHRALGVNLPPLFCEALAYPVVQPGSAEDLAWEVSDYEPSNGRRLLRLTLQKEGLHGGGVIIWWNRAIEGEPSCDTTSFPDRKRSAAAQKQQSVWTEAEALFKARVAAMPPPQQIDTDDLA